MATEYSSDVSASQHALTGMVIAAGDRIAVSRDPVYLWATRPAAARRVALVSGGGAGHEPMHGGFLGAGGLDAACPGEVFTSPHSRAIYEASRRASRGHGVLHIVKNYTGDRINFAIAAERLRAEGVRVEEVVVTDDLASDSSEVGRRGTGATMIVEKILGAAADRGADLDELVDLGRSIVAASRTVAVASRAHTFPGAPEPAFTVEPGTFEYGIGIHGESAPETIAVAGGQLPVGRMVDELLAALPSTPDGVIAVVNGLGGTSNLVLSDVLTDVHSALDAAGVVLRSGLAGTYVSALDMGGFSITLTAVQEAWLADWTAEHDTVGLPSPRLVDARALEATEEAAAPEVKEPSTWLRSLAEEIIGMSDALNALDQRSGDGDFGTNMRNAMEASLRQASGPEADLAADLRSMADAFSNDVGGSSGPLLGLLLTHLAAHAADPDKEPAAAGADGLRAGVEAITRVGGAVAGDRTIIDALTPAAYEGDDPRPVLDESSVEAALEGAIATSSMVGRRGRSSYLGDRVIGSPDPGAMAVVLMLTALVERLTGASRPDIRDAVTEAVSQ